MGKHLVTQALWEAVMGNNPARFKGANHPVEQVRWEDIVNTFLPKLKTMTGKSYQLPSEAIWEYAARGGKHHSPCQYAGSNKLKEVGWYDDNSHGSTQPVGKKLPNELGIYDMSGNVWEWCSDWYGSDYYKNSPTDNPKGPSSGSSRVLRGGGWVNSAQYCRSAYRYFLTPDYRSGTYGFRLVFVPQFII
jgi:formylglycine-generating enzyme required for sulfatase activity